MAPSPPPPPVFLLAHKMAHNGASAAFLLLYFLAFTIVGAIYLVVFSRILREEKQRLEGGRGGDAVFMWILRLLILASGALVAIGGWEVALAILELFSAPK
jgi:hypothetical protein